MTPELTQEGWERDVRGWDLDRERPEPMVTGNSPYPVVRDRLTASGEETAMS